MGSASSQEKRENLDDRAGAFTGQSWKWCAFHPSLLASLSHAWLGVEGLDGVAAECQAEAKDSMDVGETVYPDMIASLSPICVNIL